VRLTPVAQIPCGPDEDRLLFLAPKDQPQRQADPHANAAGKEHFSTSETSRSLLLNRVGLSRNPSSRLRTQVNRSTLSDLEASISRCFPHSFAAYSNTGARSPGQSQVNHRHLQPPVESRYHQTEPLAKRVHSQRSSGQPLQRDKGASFEFHAWQSAPSSASLLQ